MYYIFNKYIPHKWIVLFVNADWLTRWWLAKYYSPPSNWRKTKWLPVSNKVILKQVKLLFGPLVIQLVWYVPLCGSVNIHHYLPPHRWIIVNDLLIVWKCSQTWSFGFYILHSTLNSFLAFPSFPAWFKTLQ